MNEAAMQNGTGAQGASDETLIGEVHKNAAERLRVATSTYKGHRLVSLRVYFEAVTGSGEWRPTKKGVTFRRELLPEVIPLLRAAQLPEDALEEEVPHV